ncbi:MAG: hypothetical protein HY296_00670 [Thaumarchaeota archaeon]|nr:hypothetical protein [Nitrososphaerota archaeon]
MPRIVYGVSPIGLGHATRSIVITRLLVYRGFDVTVVSGGKAADFMRSAGAKVVDLVPDPAPKVVDGEMRGVLGWYLRSWLSFRTAKRRVRALTRELRPDLVVGDEEFSTISVGLEMGLPTTMITDELELGFARTWAARKVEARILRWYRRLQSEVSILIVPSGGTDRGNIRFVGPVVRPLAGDRTAVLQRHGLPASGNMVLLSMSGSGVGGHLVERTVAAVTGLGADKAHLVITGNRGERVSGEGVYDLGVVLDNQDLVAAADVVVSTAGKSTIDEAERYGTPVVPIPIRHHAEQERNAAGNGTRPDDIDRIGELISARLGSRTEPRTGDGGAKAADLIASLLRRAADAAS